MAIRDTVATAFQLADGNLRRFGIELFTTEWDTGRRTEAFALLAQDGIPRVDVRDPDKLRRIAAQVWLDDRDIDFDIILWTDVTFISTFFFSDAQAAFEFKMRWG